MNRSSSDDDGKSNSNNDSTSIKDLFMISSCDDEKRDAPPAERETKSALEKQISTLQTEIETQERTYRQRKAILEKGLREYDHQYETKNKVFQDALSGLYKVTKKREMNVEKGMKDLDDKWEKRFEQLVDMIEQERENNKRTTEKLEEYIEDCTNEITRLQVTIQNQNEELQQARKEREETRAEMKNILITLHIQFEHVVGQIDKNKNEMNQIRDIVLDGNEQTEQSLDEITAYVDTVHYNFNKFQDEIKNIIDTRLEAEKKSRIETKDKLYKACTIKFNEISDLVEQQGIKMQTHTNKFATIKFDGISKQIEQHERKMESLSKAMTTSKFDGLSSILEQQGHKMESNFTDKLASVNFDELSNLVEQQGQKMISITDEIATTKQEREQLQAFLEKMEINVEELHKKIDIAKMAIDTECTVMVQNVEQRIRNEIKEKFDTWGNRSTT